MAIVRDFITPEGVHVIVKDDAYAGASPEELERRRKHLHEVVARIIQSAAIQAAKEAGEDIT